MQPVDTGMVEVAADAERPLLPGWLHLVMLSPAALSVAMLAWYAVLGAP